MTFLRNGEQLLIAVVLPALALFGLGVLDVVALPTTDLFAGLSRIDAVAPGILALGLVSTSFTSLAISTAFDRRWGVLRQLATTPLGSSGIVAGKILAVFAIQALQLLVLSGIAFALGWRPALSGFPFLLVTWLLASLCFSGLGLALAARLRAEAVLALANLAWILLAASGLVLPAGTGWMAFLPQDLVATAMLTSAQGSAPWLSWLGLLAWDVIALVLAARLFRPSE